VPCAAAGAKVSAAKRQEAEDPLLRARTLAAAPRVERRQAATLAVQDVRREVADFVRSHMEN
jgi:hypothetical protein